jgi:LemA protein
MTQTFESDTDAAEFTVTRVDQSETRLRQLYSNQEVEPVFRVPRLRGLTMILSASLLSFALLGGTMLFKFNNFIELREDVRAMHGNLDSALQRRSNLVNNLVKLTLSHAELEHTIFSHTAEARTRIVDKARGSGNTPGPIHPESDTAGLPGASSQLQALMNSAPAAVTDTAQDQSPAWLQSLKGIAGKGLDATLGRLLAVVEQYPTVRSSETYLELVQSLVSIEDKVAERRERHHQALRAYNSAISNFPWHWLARATKFSRMNYYEVQDSVRKPPVISGSIYQQLTPLGSAGEARP